MNRILSLLCFPLEKHKGEDVFTASSPFRVKIHDDREAIPFRGPASTAVKRDYFRFAVSMVTGGRLESPPPPILTLKASSDHEKYLPVLHFEG